MDDHEHLWNVCAECYGPARVSNRRVEQLVEAARDTVGLERMEQMIREAAKEGRMMGTCIMQAWAEAQEIGRAAAKKSASQYEKNQQVLKEVAERDEARLASEKSIKEQGEIF